MPSPNKRGDVIRSLFFKGDKNLSSPEAPPVVTRQEIRETSSGQQPVVISSLVPGGSVADRRSNLTVVPTATSPSTNQPSAAVVDLVAEARKQVPPDNSVVRLMKAMSDIENMVPDIATRKQVAMTVLQGGGVTAEAVEAGAKEAKKAIDERLNDLLDQGDAVRKRDVDSKRAAAEQLRSQVGDVNAEIENLRAKITNLNSQANTLVQEALERENELDQFKTDVEAARAIAHQSFGF